MDVGMQIREQLWPLMISLRLSAGGCFQVCVHAYCMCVVVHKLQRRNLVCSNPQHHYNIPAGHFESQLHSNMVFHYALIWLELQHRDLP